MSIESMKLIGAERAAQLLPLDRLIEALDRAFARGYVAPMRHQHLIQRDGYSDSTLLLMPAWVEPSEPQPYIGVKIMALVPGDDPHKPNLHSSMLLFDGITSEPLAMIDGNAVTVRRTVATVGLAARHLASPQSERLLIIGSGRVGSALQELYSLLFPIRKVRIWDIDEEGADRLVARLRDLRVDAERASSLPEAVAEADIIASATRSVTPIIKGEWLSPGTHLDLIGSFKPHMREVDNAAFLRSAVYIDTADALSESGDLIQPLAEGIAGGDHIRGTLGELSRGEIPGRRDPNEITLFKTVGTAIADLAAARLIHENMR